MISTVPVRQVEDYRKELVFKEREKVKIFQKLQKAVAFFRISVMIGNTMYKYA